MDFDEYWHDLVNRAHRRRAALRGDEERFYRLSCIYGETMVDGIEAYFERRWDEFAADMGALRDAGFGGLASDYERARDILFGSAPLDRETVEAITSNLLEETEQTEGVRAEIDKIYDRIIPQLERLAEYKYAFGLAAGLYRDA